MNPENCSPELKKLIQDYQEKRNKGNKALMTAAKKLLREAKKSGDAHLLGYAYFAVADVYSMWSMDDTAMMQHLVKAVEYLQVSEEFALLGRAYNLLGINALRSGHRMLALDYYLQALEYTERADSGIIPGLIRSNMGSIYVNIADYPKAISCLQAGKRIISRFKKDKMYYRNMEIICYKLGVSYTQTGKLKQAEKSLAQGEKLYEEDPQKTLFPGRYVLLLLRLHIAFSQHEEEKSSAVIGEIMDIIEQYRITTDSIEDIYDFMKLLLAMNRIGDLGRVLELIMPHIDEFQITSQKISVMEMKIQYHRALGEEEATRESLEYAFELYLQFKTEQQRGNRFSLEMRERMEELQKGQKKIQEENERLMRQATIDELTGLPNRYALNEYAENAFDRAAAERYSLAVEILDIDHFKQYNDTYGHQEGDRCLQKVAAQIESICRENKGVYAARYGGDEFVIIYEDYSDDEVTEMAERLRYRVNQLHMENKGMGKGVFISISQGIRNSVPASGNKLWDFMYAADNALYDIKKRNKGTVELIHRAVISQKSLQDARRT